jgi:excisionase family DNA binding protein
MTTFYTTTQAAQYLGISVRRVRKLCETGKLRAEKFGKSWLIPKTALGIYKPGKPGRPPKSD